MAEAPQSAESDRKRKIGSLSAWVRLLAVLFRVLIVLGLMGFLFTLILFLATSHFRILLFLIPVFILVLGLAMARLEYRLYDLLYELEHDAQASD